METDARTDDWAALSECQYACKHRTKSGGCMFAVFGDETAARRFALFTNRVFGMTSWYEQRGPYTEGLFRKGEELLLNVPYDVAEQAIAARCLAILATSTLEVWKESGEWLDQELLDEMIASYPGAEKMLEMLALETASKTETIQ